MHHLVKIVSNTVFVPCHLLRGFLGHVQSLDPRYERKVPYDFHGDCELPLRLTISGVDLKEPRGFALWTGSVSLVLFSK